jgi:hypothetical protein
MFALAVCLVCSLLHLGNAEPVPVTLQTFEKNVLRDSEGWLLLVSNSSKEFEK